MSKIFNKVAIIGLGLIGGSLGISIRKNHIASKVIGFSRKSSTLKHAKKIGAIDEGSKNFKLLKDCDLVILSAPVKTIIDQIKIISPLLSKDCLIIDVGSTKFEIIQTAEKFLDRKVDFIGMHPLAGSEKRGIKNAGRMLFTGSLCILTPTKRNKPKNVLKVKQLWKKLGARTVVLSPLEHDKIIAFTSHLPHLTAFSLISSPPNNYLKYASGGLKDITRVAGSDAMLWADIFFTNKEQVLKSISSLENQLSEFKDIIRHNKQDKLIKKLEAAKLKRNKLSY